MAPRRFAAFLLLMAAVGGSSLVPHISPPPVTTKGRAAALASATRGGGGAGGGGGVSRALVPPIAVLCAANVAAVHCRNSLPAVLGALDGSQASAAAGAMALSPLINFAGKLALGPLADAAGPQRLLPVSLLLLSAACATIALRPAPVVLAGGWIALDFVYASLWGTLAARLRQLQPPSEWNAGLGVLAGSARASGFVAVSVFGALLRCGASWRHVFGLCAAMAALPAAIELVGYAKTHPAPVDDREVAAAPAAEGDDGRRAMLMRCADLNSG